MLCDMQTAESTYVTSRVPSDLLEDMRRRAQSEDRSVSALIRLAVRGYLGDKRQENPNE
jgi:metal-responsive CopG/Arc/MetJ family transcriptional regulator